MTSRNDLDHGFEKTCDTASTPEERGVREVRRNDGEKELGYARVRPIKPRIQETIEFAAAMSTVLAVKDRLMGHNPPAAIYTVDSDYRSLK